MRDDFGVIRRTAFLSATVAVLLAPAAAASNRVVETPIPTPDSRPVGITPGPGGYVWFTEGLADKIGRLRPGGRVEEVATTAESHPRGTSDGPAWITAGPEGDIWFTQSNPAGISRLTPDGLLTEFRLPIEPRRPIGIALGSDGNLWFADRWGSIWKATPGGQLMQFPVVGPSNYEPNGIVAGPDGALWFTAAQGFIGRLTTTGAETRFPLPPSAGPLRHIAVGADGNLWFTEERARCVVGWCGRIGRITPEGRITQFTVPTEEARPVGITTGPDGNVWFTERHADTIGRITPAGRIVEFPLPTDMSRPFGITAGPGNEIWFTETWANAIGRIRPGGLGIEVAQATAYAHRGIVRVRLACSGGRSASRCDGILRITAGGHAIARNPYSLLTEATRAFSVRLNRRGRAVLGRRPKLEAEVSAGVAGGQRGERMVLLVGD